MRSHLVAAALLSLILVGIGCGGSEEGDGEPDESQAAVFQMLTALEASISLDAEGKIVGVDFEEETQGDEAVELLREISTIRRVSLTGAAVTDAALETLAGMSGLDYVNLEDTGVSNKAVQRLRQALPDCHIDYGDGGAE